MNGVVAPILHMRPKPIPPTTNPPAIGTPEPKPPPRPPPMTFPTNNQRQKRGGGGKRGIFKKKTLPPRKASTRKPPLPPPRPPRATAGRTPQADRPGAGLVILAAGMGDQRQRGRHHHGGTATLDDTGADQGQCIGGDPAGQRRETKEQDAQQIGATRPQSIADRASR